MEKTPSYKSILSKILNKPFVKFVIFVDGDNAMINLDSITSIGPQNDDWEVQVICVLVVGRDSPTHLAPIKENIWFHLIMTSTNYPQATDGKLYLSMGYLDALINKTVPFILMTSDGVGKEIIENVKMDRECHLIGESKHAKQQLCDILHPRVNIYKRVLYPWIKPSSLIDDELRYLYINHWKGMQVEFCGINNLDRGNFSKWMRGKRALPQARNVVIDWIERENILDIEYNLQKIIAKNSCSQ